MQHVRLFVDAGELMDFLCFKQEARMDSDNEMIVHQFMEEEADATADKEEHMAVLLGMLQLQVEEDTFAPIRGGSSTGQRKSKPRQGLEGHAMLYNDCFSDDPTYNAKDFRR
jgi:hypothetical protein